MASYKSRYEILLNLLYPKKKNGGTYFDSVEQGTTISGWSPHNLRRVIISEKFMGIELFKCTSKNKFVFTSVQVPDSVNMNAISSPGEALLDLIFKKDHGRQFSNIEEVIFCEYEHQEIFNSDISTFTQLQGSFEGYKRLVHISLVKSMTFKDVYFAAMKSSKYGELLIKNVYGDIDTMYKTNNKLHTIFTEKSYYTLNSGNYEIDTGLKKYFETGIETLKRELEQNYKNSIRLTKGHLDRIASKSPNGFSTSYIDMLGDLVRVTNIVSGYKKETIVKAFIQASSYYRAALGDFAKDILPTKESFQNKKYDGFGRDTTADDTKETHELLTSLKLICEPLYISCKCLTDDNLESIIGVLINIIRSTYLSNIIIQAFKESGYSDFAKALKLTVTDCLCLSVCNSVYNLSNFDVLLKLCVSNQCQENLYCICGHNSKGQELLISDIHAYFSKCTVNVAVSDDDDVEGDEWSIDESDENADDSDDDDDVEGDIWDTDEENSTENSDTTNDSQYASLIVELNQKYTIINSSRFKDIVMERLSVSDMTSLSKTEQIEFDSVYITAFLYLVLYERINSVVRVARPMIQLMIEAQVSTPISYDDREIEIINKYKNLQGNYSSSNSFSFAHKVSVDEQKESRSTLIPLLKDIVERVVG